MFCFAFVCKQYEIRNNFIYNQSLYMKSKICLTLLGFLFCSVPGRNLVRLSDVFQKNTNQPIESATFRVKLAPTLPNSSGNFRITIPGDKSVLVVSSVGFNNTEIAVGKNSAVEVFMPQAVSTMEDIVVIGYGTAKKKDVTGATSSISGSQIEKIPVTNVAEALTGKLAGVQVTTVDGTPGAETVIRVRGGGSVTQDNSPLYIVDGFPVSSINDIATSDIASIDVLKDAFSSAIYGARGANGVVIVTTKKPKGGRTVVSYNGYGQVGTLRKTRCAISLRVCFGSIRIRETQK